jgi:hypothetical protein
MTHTTTALLEKLRERDSQARIGDGGLLVAESSKIGGYLQGELETHNARLAAEAAAAPKPETQPDLEEWSADAAADVYERRSKGQSERHDPV